MIEVRSGGAGVVAVRGHGRDAANFGAVRHRRGSLIGEVADLKHNKKFLKQFEMKLVKVLLILLAAMIEILNKF